MVTRDMVHVFLDFDRTLFDTEAFYNSLELTYIEGIVAGKMSADFSKFLYPDSVSFMRNANEAGIKCHLVTFGRRGVQECKVKLSGIEPYFIEKFYVEQGSKAEVIAKHLQSGVSCEKAVFIDDTIAHLEECVKIVPPLSLLRMARGGAKGSELVDDRFLTVQSLEEVLKFVIEDNI